MSFLPRGLPVKNAFSALKDKGRLPLVLGGAGGVIILVLLLVISLMGMRLRQLSVQLRQQTGLYERLVRQGGDLKASFENAQTEAATLQKQLTAATAEQARLAAQVKELSAEREKAAALEKEAQGMKADLAKVSRDLGESETARKSAQYQLDSITEKFKVTEKEKDAILIEKTGLQVALDEEKNKTGSRRLEEENAGLKKEKESQSKELKRLSNELAQSQEENRVLQQEVAALSKKAGELGAAYKKAEKTSDHLADRIIDAPGHMADLARQNQVLVKRTGTMHYNMGVFYMKRKEFSRAVAEFKRAVELVPADAQAHFNLGYIYAEHLGNRSRAVKHLRTYLEYAQKDDKDKDWAQKYIMTYEAWEAKKPIQ